MDKNKELFKAISDTRKELSLLRRDGTKQEQLECFQRLLNLYMCLNVDLENEIDKEIKAA